MHSYPVTRFATIVSLFVLAILVASPVTFGVSAQNSTTGVTQQMIRSDSYPPARKSDQIDDYHGTKVSDPYRWLEDLDSEETRAWVEAENKLTFAFLNSIS